MATDGFLADARLVIVAGKGGVGKTVVSTALARAASRAGRDALLVEVDGRNHVANLLGTPPAGYEERVLFGPPGPGASEGASEGTAPPGASEGTAPPGASEGTAPPGASEGTAPPGASEGTAPPGASEGTVWARTITPDRALVEYLDDHGLGRISEQLARAGLLEILATSTPGIKDLLVLGKIKQLERDHPASLIVVDAPAAGHAMSFLRAPLILAETARVGRINRQAVECLEMLRDPKRCQVLLVTLAEETPINELAETAEVLSGEIGVRLGPAVVNGLWPTEPAHPRSPVDAIVGAAAERAVAFRRRHAAAQTAQVERLASLTALPHVLLPAHLTSDLGPAEIDHLADLLHDGLDRAVVAPAPRRRKRSPRRSRGDPGPPVPQPALTAPAGPGPLARLVADHEVVVCAGTGGVGKTSTAAAIAVAAAQRGRRVAVVTIDPARRLADALGIAELGNEPTEVAGPWPGSLHAVMLDAKRTFDGLIAQHATTEDQAERILSNRFYQNFSTGLSGSHELMAMEKLFGLYDSGRFDLLIVDTPPTRNALAFLHAPTALGRLMESRLFRAITAPGRGVMRVMNMATQTLLRQVGRIVGREVVDDVIAFFQAFEGIQDGFYERTKAVVALLESDASTFVVVASPRHDAVREAEYFVGELQSAGLSVGGLVVNRMTPDLAAGVSTRRLRAACAAGPGDPALTALDNVVKARAREAHHVATLISALPPGVAVARVPQLADDVHDLTSLTDLAGWLVGPMLDGSGAKLAVSRRRRNAPAR